MREIFSTVGIKLPRAARAQAQIGYTPTEFAADATDEDKVKILLEDAVPGIVLLGMPGHIMLYLGEVEEEPYAIHAAWGYREDHNGQDEVRLINRVAVTTLELGKGSRKGSYLSRLATVAIVALP